MIGECNDEVGAALTPSHPATQISTDALLAWLCSRRSMRRFKSQAVPRDLIDRLLETATWAPSAHNRQPWQFVVLESCSARNSLVENLSEDYLKDLLRDGLPEVQAKQKVSSSKSLILDAPCAILLCLEMALIDRYPDDARQQAEIQTAIQSVALAGGTLLLAAHAAGLASVWLCAPLFAKASARSALDLPEPWDPQALILLGYPQKISKARQRRPLEEVVTYL